MAVPTLPPILQLPYDVRNLIYAAVLEEDYKSPKSPKDLPTTDCVFPFWLSHSSFIHRPPPTAFICHGLLGSCRQMREEMLRRIELDHKRGGFKCKLDCMLLRNDEMFPSWSWLPVPSRYLTTLEVDLRILTADADGCDVSPGNRWFFHDPAFRLSELLEEFFRRGPTYRPSLVIKDDVRIKKLVVNVIAPPEVSDETLSNCPGPLHDGSSHPADVFRSLTANCLLPRAFKSNVEALDVHYRQNHYLWNSTSDPNRWVTRVKGNNNARRNLIARHQALTLRRIQPTRRSTRTRALHNFLMDPIGQGRRR